MNALLLIDLVTLAMSQHFTHWKLSIGVRDSFACGFKLRCEQYIPQALNILKIFLPTFDVLQFS